MIEDLLDQPSWFQADPEYVVITPKLFPGHRLATFFNQRYCHYCQFTPGSEDTSWINVYNEVAQYVTHLLVFMSPSDTVLASFLKTAKGTDLKVRLVII